MAPTRNSKAFDTVVQERDELKRKLNEALSQKEDDRADDRAAILQASAKKPRGQAPFQDISGPSPNCWVVQWNQDLALWFRKQGVIQVWRKVKFLASETEKTQCMEMILKVSTVWKRLSTLSKAEYLLMIKEYTRVYGKAIATEINTKRNNLQQGVRKVWRELREKRGKKMPTAKQFTNTLARHNLLVLPEKTKAGKTFKKNKELNKKNAKYRERFDMWVELFVPQAIGVNWKEVNFTQIPLSGDPKNGRPSPITAADEAMILVTIANCEEKWELEFSGYPAPEKPDDPKEGTPCPKSVSDGAVKFSSKKSGNSEFGGWTAAGRHEFARLRGICKKARSQPETLQAEYQCCERLYKKHDMAKKLASRKQKAKKPPKMDLTDAELWFESDDDEAMIEYLESDDEDGDPSLRPADAQNPDAQEEKKDEEEEEDDDETVGHGGN